MEKKDLDKRVRALTTLTKEDETLALTAGYFDFEHHLPAVYALSSLGRLLLPYHCFFLMTFDLFSFQDHQFLVSRPPLPEGGSIQNVPVDAASEAPEAQDSQDEEEAEDSLERTSSTTSPPRKHVEELASSSASAHKNVAGEASALEDEEELFNALDS
jgi:hypothetical protein